VQVTWQTEPDSQVTLPLSPTVTTQVEPLAQSILQDWAQLPVHVLPLPQSREQLPAAPPHVLCEKLQLLARGQLQFPPLQLAGMGVLLPAPPSVDDPSARVDPASDGPPPPRLASCPHASMTEPRTTVNCHHRLLVRLPLIEFGG
jgi:hypothetical protein